MTEQEFENLLETLVLTLNEEIGKGRLFSKPKEFEDHARVTIGELARVHGVNIDRTPHPHIFPDIVVGEFGVEVKFTTNDTWRSVANSIFESTRKEDVKQIYVLYGKLGGVPEVRWGKYEQCVMHVRTSHVPRFEVEMYPTQNLFEKMGITYTDFQQSSPDQKMRHIREYARARLKPGERLWWLEEKEEQEHALPLQVRLYMNLPQDEKRRLRAEAALLCPQIVKPSRTRRKYNDATLYILTYHGVLCPQARDLFSAGSVALRSDSKRGGIYIMRALKDIELEMREAAKYLEDALFVEYWGEIVKPEHRITEWLVRADEYARDWQPSKVLFTKNQ